MKQNNQIFDFIIIGQGLAGTVFTHELSKKTSNFLVIDGEKHTASFAAAGIINPITGRNFVKSWLIDELLPIAIHTYHEFEKKLNTSIINTLDIVRTVNTVKEENDWLARSMDLEYMAYIGSLFESENLNKWFNESCKYSKTIQGYKVNLQQLILSYRELLKSQNKYLNHQILNDGIQINEDIITVNGMQCKNIVFCQGYQAVDNLFCSNIAFKFSKGHSIIFKCDLPIDFNYKDQFYITPLGDNFFWTGVGNEWDNVNYNIDAEKIESIKQDIESKLNQKIEIITTRSGIRPTMVRRKPLVDRHPFHKNIYVFNGLGTKGTSLAPYFAKKLINLIFDEKQIPKALKVSFQDASI